MEIGPVSDGMAISSLSWAEIAAWSQVTKTALSSWASRAIREMSKTYATEYQETKDNQDRPSPFAGEMGPERRDAIEQKLRAQFGKRMNG